MTPAEERPAEERPAASDPPTPPAAGEAAPPAPQAGGLGAWPVAAPQAERTPSISPGLRASHADRNAIAERLRDAFADGRLDEEEFDVRIQAALSARTRDELEPLLADLIPAGMAQAPAPSPALADSGTGPRHSLVAAVMGGAERKGRWRVPAEATAIAVMGGVELDLRAATLTSQVTTIRVAAIMGGVDIIVPPGVRVDMAGIPLMGGGDNRVDDAHLPPTAPLVKVQYLAIMGGVSARTKVPKGAHGDHRLHRRDDRRELRKEQRELRDRRRGDWDAD
jgi:hypothetical protein